MPLPARFGVDGANFQVLLSRDFLLQFSVTAWKASSCTDWSCGDLQGFLTRVRSRRDWWVRFRDRPKNDSAAIHRSSNQEDVKPAFDTPSRNQRFHTDNSTPPSTPPSTASILTEHAASISPGIAFKMFALSEESKVRRLPVPVPSFITCSTG